MEAVSVKVVSGHGRIRWPGDREQGRACGHTLGPSNRCRTGGARKEMNTDELVR